MTPSAKPAAVDADPADQWRAAWRDVLSMRRSQRRLQVRSTMAHLFLNPETDSVYLDVTTGDGAQVSTAEPAERVYLHAEEAG